MRWILCIVIWKYVSVWHWFTNHVVDKGRFRRVCFWTCSTVCHISLNTSLCPVHIHTAVLGDKVIAVRASLNMITYQFYTIRGQYPHSNPVTWCFKSPFLYFDLQNACHLFRSSCEQMLSTLLFFLLFHSIESLCKPIKLSFYHTASPSYTRPLFLCP